MAKYHGTHLPREVASPRGSILQYLPVVIDMCFLCNHTDIGYLLQMHDPNSDKQSGIWTKLLLLTCRETPFEYG